VIRAARGAPARGPHAAKLACVVFAMLVLASVVALFEAQVLKREAPLLLKPQGATDIFQPAGSGIHAHEAHFDVRTSVDDVLDVSVVAASGRPVDVIAKRLPIHKYQHKALAWDGRTTGGANSAPGIYMVAVRFERAGQTVIAPGFRLLLDGGSR
jgi:hypothetical protein